MFGRVDLARYSAAASTVRNCTVKYQGGLSSRAGSKFVGYSKQTGRAFPPRLIAYQFNINQGLELEFGHFYMRVIMNGSFVTEAPLTITNVTRANPAQVTFDPAMGIASATANIGAVISSYAPGEKVTLAGGDFFTAGVLSITNTKVTGLQLDADGASYSAADTITLAGGTPTTKAIVTVDTVDGSGHILTFHVSTAGVYTGNPAGLAFTQDSTTGGGTGATFQFAIMSPNVVAVSTTGAYSSLPINPVAQASTTGSGIGATFNVTGAVVSVLANGDWVEIDVVAGMTQLNGNTYIARNVTPTTLTLEDVFGNTINSSLFGAYAGGGTMSRIFTLVTPYSEVDLDYLKTAQSADVMTICCVNQITSVEYAPQDLARGSSNTDWTLEAVIASPSVTPPATLTGAASSGGNTTYNYAVTSVDPNNGTESIASPIVVIASAVDVAATAGSITLTWPAVDGVTQYNIYKALPAYADEPVPPGSEFGYAGTVFGTQFVDSNVVPDFSQTPPLFQDPFARGTLLSATPISGGIGYTGVTLTVNTATGSGAILRGIVVNGGLVGIIIDNAGKNYSLGDTLTVNGDGSGATAKLVVGPQKGTYPGVVSYFQERRVYGYTLNEPDTYFMSQPAAFKDFDFRIPEVASDAITGSPWAEQVNGIQAMVNRPGGLVTFTGKDAWQLTGSGGSSFNPQPITPATQQAQPQAFNGCHDHVGPLGIENEILYVQSKGAIIRDLSYNYFVNVYTGSDITLTSSHLFTGYQIVQWAWAEEPFKTVWVVRSDGAMLSLTFVKDQQVIGWARHDTFGLYVSVSSITEPAPEATVGPLTNGKAYTDAVYVGTQRYTPAGTAYMIERFDDRLWSNNEDPWCVDCGLRLDQPEPDAVLTVSSSTGSGTISSIAVVNGGQKYSAGTTAAVVDDNGNGPGAGCTVALTIVSGVITAAVPSGGAGYTYPQIVLTDPSNAGGGGVLVAALTNTATAKASGNVFSGPNVGYVIRGGGGIMTITAVNSSTQVTVNITWPITQVVTDAYGNETPVPQPSGNWTMTQPVSSVGGAEHLAGMTVTGTYDGLVLPPTVVAADGTVALPAPATAVTIGLGFVAQIQSPYFTTQGTTVEGQRKKVAEVVLRVQDSVGFTVGTNQPDGSTLSPPRLAPRWSGMEIVQKALASYNRAPYGSPVDPLWCGDSLFVPVESGFGVPGQIACQQALPKPLNLLAFVPSLLPGDLPDVQDPHAGTWRKSIGSVIMKSDG